MLRTFGLAVVLTIGTGLPGLLALEEAQTGPPPIACPSEEGKAVAGPQGLTFCSEPARIENPAMGGLQEGVRIAGVDPKGPGASAGFQAGDIVYRVGGMPVNTGAAAVKRLQSLRPGEEAVVNFWRGTLPFLIRLRG
jgi:S1-C subfamily serine protease